MMRPNRGCSERSPHDILQSTTNHEEADTNSPKEPPADRECFNFSKSETRTSSRGMDVKICYSNSSGIGWGRAASGRHFLDYSLKSKLTGILTL